MGEHVRLDNRVMALKMLFDNLGKLTPSSAIAGELGVTRQGISKMVGILRDEGIPISSVPHKGYVLEGPPEEDRFSPSWAEMLLWDCPLGHPILHFERIESTQNPVKDLAQKGHPEGVTAVADRQTMGRGRRDRRWESPEGGLYASVLLRPPILPGHVQMVNLACAMAMGDAIEAHCGIKVDIKWPNDLLVGSRKLCGMLSEGAVEADRVHHIVAGIGVNIKGSPTIQDSPQDVTSIAEEGGTLVARHDLLASFLRSLKHHIGILCEDRKAFINSYRGRCSTLGRRIVVSSDSGTLEGLAEDVEDEGSLLIRTSTGLLRFSAGDVRHVRPIKGGEGE